MTGPSYLSSLVAPELPAEACEQIDVVDVETGDRLCTFALRFGSRYGEADALLAAIVEVGARDLGVTPAAIRNLVRVQVSAHGQVFARPVDPVAVAQIAWAEVRPYYVLDGRAA